MSKRMFIMTSTVAAAVAASTFGDSLAAQERISLRIASGHTDTNAYVLLIREFFIPEATERVAERTDYELNFITGWGGAMVSTSDTLEGVQSGIIDIGAYCFCFEPSNLPLHTFQVMLPFGPMDPTLSVQVARDVYDKVPYMEEVFEENFGQKLLALIGDTGYNLGTTFPWEDLSELEGRRIGGGGLNLRWLDPVGIVPVQAPATEAYTSMQTGVFDGYIHFPTNWLNLRLYEVGPYYTEIDFGSITWHSMTINMARWNSLPEEVQEILLEVSRELEIESGRRAKERYPQEMEELAKRGTNIRQVDDEVRRGWAEALAHWPQEQAAELDAQGLPGTEVLQTALEAAENAGYEWPVRYELK